MAILTAILLASGVLLGTGALVVDVGLLYDEREQLQSGADAASMVTALTCAKGGTCTSAALSATAVTYAKKNALDNAAGAQMCVNGTGCPAWNTSITCPAMPTPPSGQSNGQWVEVRTTTVTSAGATLLPPVFAGALSGVSYSGTRVGACARVNWGPPANVGSVFAMGISECDWKRMTTNGTTFFGPLGSLLSQTGALTVLGQNPPAANSDSAISAVIPAVVLGLPLPSCTTPSISLVTPRGYVWLNGTSGAAPDANCMIQVSVGDYPKSFLLSGLTLAGNNRCGARLQSLRTSGLPILVPIFDAIQQAALAIAPAYHISGFAPFVVTGYTALVPGVLGAIGSILNGGLLPSVAALLCTTTGCVYGYFTKALVPVSEPTFGSGTNYGATVIGRTG